MGRGGMRQAGARLLLTLQAVLLLSAVGGTAALAQGGAPPPGKPLRIIVAFPPGGATDIVARYIQQPLSEALGQPVVIENKAGGSGIIGTEAVARAPPDGTVIGMGTSSLAASPALYASLPYDVLKDIRPITIVARSPNLISVHVSSPIKTLGDLLEAAKRSPGRLIVATSGNGNAQHFGLEQIKITTATDIVHLPYRGAGPALNDLAAGQVEIGWLNIAGSLPFVKSGQLRPIAITSLRRSSSLPDIPTVSEQFAGFDFSEWFALIAPGGLPDDLVERLYVAVVKAARTPDVVAKIRDAGMELNLNTPAEFRALMLTEHKKLGDLARRANIKLD